MLCITATHTIAQTQVRGVETKVVKYEGEKHGDNNLWYGYEFTNMNSIPVSVDAKLYDGKELIDTKCFVLESKESYIWKFEGRYHFYANSGKSPSREGHNHRVEYKAYKLE